MPPIVNQLTGRLRRAWRKLFPQQFDRYDQPVEWQDLRAVCQHEWLENPVLLEQWDRLLAASPAATTFHSPTWQRAVVETLGKKDRLRLIVVWRGLQLVAVLPMSIRDDGLLESFAPGVTDYLDPLIHPAHEPGAWRVILQLLSKLRSGPWRKVTLHNLRDRTSFQTLLPDLAREEGFAYDARVVENCPVLTLPDTWEAYLATLDAHERKETRRKVNKVMTKGNGRIVRCPADPAQIAQALPVALALMEQAPGEKGEAVKKYLRPLLERAAPALIRENRLWLDTLYVNDEPAACTLQFPHSTGPQLYNCGFDGARREWSPGVVLTAEVMRSAIESGAQVFDLLRGQEPYKYKLGATDRPLWMANLTKA